MPETEGKHAPIRESVRVDCPIEEAFQLFTERFDEWWPLASHSVAGAEAESCAIEPWAGGRIFERTRSGEEREWGCVTAWDPPHRVAFTWHPAARADRDQVVDVEFRVEADGTRVTLTHCGWHQTGAQACAQQAHYTAQWSNILRLCFAEFVCARMLVAV